MTFAITPDFPFIFINPTVQDQWASVITEETADTLLVDLPLGPKKEKNMWSSRIVTGLYSVREKRRSKSILPTNGGAHGKNTRGNTIAIPALLKRRSY